MLEESASGGGGMSALGGLLPGGVCSLGGCLLLLPGGCISQHALRQTHPPPLTESQTPVKTLPWPNFVAAGNQGGRQLVYFCEECKKGYSQKCNYKVHMDKHAGVRYSCNVCSKKFAKTQDRDDHMSVHTGVWRFKCDTCDKGFNEKRLHLKHRESHFF